MREAVIIGAVRTPVGRYMGGLKEVKAYDLAAQILNEVIKRASIESSQVDEVILGQSYQNGEYVNIARMALLKAGWPDSIPGITLDRRCCTGLDTVCFAAMKVQSGNADIVVAGGVESMSNAEFYVPGDIKWGIGGKRGMPRGHGDLTIWGIPFYDRIQSFQGFIYLPCFFQATGEKILSVQETIIQFEGTGKCIEGVKIIPS